MGSNKNEKTNLRNILISSIFLMVTSALGPGFLTQTANFTEELGSDFAFGILLSLIRCNVSKITFGAPA